MAKTELLQGTLDMLILKTLTRERRHGWAIAQRIHELSEECRKINAGWAFCQQK